nr:hydroxyacylglutathione hydrolase-like protein isoform X2 [Caretta caretta]
MEAAASGPWGRALAHSDRATLRSAGRGLPVPAEGSSPPRAAHLELHSPGTMKVKVISVLEDNYMYLVIEENTKEAVVVDVAVPKRLLEIVRKEGVALKAILTTHHHWDHARGNEELAKVYPELQVYGADERIGALTHKVTHNEELKFGDINVRCLFTPCHTSGHVCYFMWEENSPDAPAVFSESVLWARVHREEPQVCFESGTGERDCEKETRLGKTPRRRGLAHGALHSAGGVRLQPLPAGLGRISAEIHGQDGSGGRAASSPHREG